MTGITAQAALVVTAAALLCGAAVLAATRLLLPALAVMLDMLTAAGLLRLAGGRGWGSVATAAVIVAVRHVAVAGLRAARPHVAERDAAR